jgi:hypothetical protein
MSFYFLHLNFYFTFQSIVNIIQTWIKIIIIIHCPVIIVLLCIQKMLDGIDLVSYGIFQVCLFIYFCNKFHINDSDQTCEVFYIDYGNMEELPIDLVHEILPDFTQIPARAIACTIAEVKHTDFKCFGT